MSLGMRPMTVLHMESTQMSKIGIVVFVISSFVAPASGVTAAGVQEKKIPFPPPIQWKSGNVEISLVGVAWGPADAPEMISKGRAKLPREEPRFFPDRAYALALQFQAKAPGLPGKELYVGSGIVRVGDVSGELEAPMELTPSGFVKFSGSPGTCDVHFAGTNSTEYWDFFPLSRAQREFLFQAFPFSALSQSNSQPIFSFRIILRDNGIDIINASAGSQGECADFTKRFGGTIGPHSKASLELTQKGTVLSGTEQYIPFDKTLWLKGSVDTFGNFVLDEHYPQDHVTGIFKGKFSRGCQAMTGYFSKPDGSRLLPFEFHESEAQR